MYVGNKQVKSTIYKLNTTKQLFVLQYYCFFVLLFKSNDIVRKIGLKKAKFKQKTFKKY